MKLFKSDNMMQSVLIVLALALVVYLVWQYLNDNNKSADVELNSVAGVSGEAGDDMGHVDAELLDGVVGGGVGVDTEDNELDVGLEVAGVDAGVSAGMNNGQSDVGAGVAGLDAGVSAGMQGVGVNVGGLSVGLGDVHEGFAVNPAEAAGLNAGPKALNQMHNVSPNQLPAECFPKDVLSSADLLPMDANSKFAQVAPSGQGSLQDKNFLNAGFHIGVNSTGGSSMRNANRQLRSDPVIKKVNVSPWQNSTIDPDISRRPLEIGSM